MVPHPSSEPILDLRLLQVDPISVSWSFDRAWRREPNESATISAANIESIIEGHNLIGLAETDSLSVCYVGQPAISVKEISTLVEGPNDCRAQEYWIWKLIVFKHSNAEIFKNIPSSITNLKVDPERICRSRFILLRRSYEKVSYFCLYLVFLGLFFLYL